MAKKHLQVLSRIYVYSIAFSTFPLLIFTIPSLRFNRLPYILFWIILEMAADLKPFRVIYYQQMEMTMSFAVQFAAVILLDTGEAVYIVLIATIATEIISQKSWDRVLFNAGQYGLSLAVIGVIFHLLKMSPSNVPIDIISDFPAILVSVSVYCLLNTFFISVVISLTSGNRLIDVFFCDFKVIASYYLNLAPISIAASLLYRDEHPYIVFIMTPPLIMADQALRRYYSLNQETQTTLRALASVIDERDKYTYSHSSNVAEYAKKIAEYMNLPPDDIYEIEIAGQVHDLGKIGTEDRILFKPTKLNDEEYEHIKKHPVIAYRLLSNLKPYKNGAVYVLHHHERFDGSGYPAGLTGSDIPLGARILAVADSYDAMTTNRPYRKALSQSAAVDELRRCSGTQFDPKVIDAFIDVLKNDYGYKENDYSYKEMK